jgi:hypothetical protein
VGEIRRARKGEQVMSHTEGPWTLRRKIVDGIGKIGGSSIVGLSGERICTIESILGEELAEANARLITAAPDLLEACWEAEELLETSTLNQAKRRVALKNIRAAIARATDEEGTEKPSE